MTSANSEASRNETVAWRSQRLAENATWKAQIFPERQTAPTIDALVLAGERLYLASYAGQLQTIAADTGEVIARKDLDQAAPLWDGLAVADGHLYLTTARGELICLGESR